MNSLAIQRLESLLQTRKLDNTVAGRRPSDDRQVVSTGVASLDAALGGGWPCGEVSELVGARSSGRTSTLVSTLAAATSTGGVVGFVDAFDRFDPRSAAASGVDLDRVLWVRGPSLNAGRHALVERAVHNAIRALDLIVRAGGFAVAALDLGDVPARCIRGLPFTTWLRLAHANEGRDTACLLVGDAPIGRSARGVSLRLDPTRRWIGTHPQSRRFAGFEITPRATGRTSLVDISPRPTASRPSVPMPLVRRPRPVA